MQVALASRTVALHCFLITALDFDAMPLRCANVSHGREVKCNFAIQESGLSKSGSKNDEGYGAF
jgi:hypothetical protein